MRAAGITSYLPADSDRDDRFIAIIDSYKRSASNPLFIVDYLGSDKIIDFIAKTL